MSILISPSHLCSNPCSHVYQNFSKNLVINNINYISLTQDILVIERSTDPPKTTSEEEKEPNPTPKTKTKKDKEKIYEERKKRQRQQYAAKKKQQQKEEEDIEQMKQQLIKLYGGPFDHIWEQLPSIEFDEKGDFNIGNKKLNKAIFECKVQIRHIKDNYYAVCFRHSYEYQQHIGRSAGGPFAYGEASMLRPRYSRILKEDVTMLQQEYCIDSYRMLHDYNNLEDKENEKIRYATWKNNANHEYKIKGLPKNWDTEVRAMYDKTEIRQPTSDVHTETESEKDSQQESEEWDLDLI